MRKLIAVILLWSAFLAHADGGARLKDLVAARALTDQVMAKVAIGDFEAGIRLAKPYLIIPEAEFEALVGQVNLQIPMMNQRFGKSVGAEFIREDRAGESLLRIVQIQKFEKHAVRWTFIFYKSPTGWCINTFFFDDKIQSLFIAGGLGGFKPDARRLG